MGVFRNYLRPADKNAGKDEPTVPIDQPVSSKATSERSSTSNPRANRLSAYPLGEFRESAIRNDVMVTYLHQQQLIRMWGSEQLEEGVILKRAKDDFVCCPADLANVEGGFYDAVRALNVKCAMTLNTKVIKLFIKQSDLDYVPLKDGLRVQILPTIGFLPRCQKHHFAAFIQDSQVLVIWDDDPTHILQRGREIEEQLMSMIWSGTDEMDEKTPGTSKRGSRAPSVHIKELTEGNDEESAGEVVQEKPRRIVLMQAFLCAGTLFLMIAAMGSGWKNIAQEIKIDSTYLRCAILIVVPLQCWLSLFFFQSVIGCCMQMIGPISQINANTKFYSGLAPPRLRGSALPHVTIQCPVYKEGLAAVIDPTIKSVKQAISTYEMQGGTANIFVNDDGMQLIPEEEAAMRREYYEEHNIGWVARPKHNPKPENGEKAFVRAGKFKKASNMNYALRASSRVEDKLSSINRTSAWTVYDEAEAYDNALAEVIEEDEGRTWAGGNIRVGDYILLIDSDTRVPIDCFLDAVSEMELSPQVAIIQFSSGVMNVTTSFFEKGITFFTNLIYTAIQYAVACGDVAPFVGHNAFLRWSAVQDVAYDSPEGEKYWSEATVSEDFDMALRLQTQGYLVRLASYAGLEFKEGVSLTVYDELARWEKYAYGCSELLFHPLKDWIFKGPFTPLFRRFIASNMQLPSKLTILAYIGTYYAIACAWIFVIMNYFLLGWFNGYLDHYYVDSFKIYFSIIVVFTALGNVSLAIYRYRIEEKTLFGASMLSPTSFPTILHR
ncbi:MAG: hypothetical protein Q9227_005710 [Pyrenula ochraceoflavens]